MYLEENLRIFLRFFSILSPSTVYSVESSSFFFIREILESTYVSKVMVPRKKTIFAARLLLIETTVYSGVNGGIFLTTAKKSRPSWHIIVPCQHLWNCCWHTNTTRDFTFQVSTFEIHAADGCTDWRRFCKGFCYLQMPILGFYFWAIIPGSTHCLHLDKLKGISECWFFAPSILQM